jgi:hypothetical protein
LRYAEEASFNVVHMPLSKEARARFNQTAAENWFKKLEGLPYGYHNGVAMFVDTPERNWPPLIPGELVHIAFSIIESFDKNMTDVIYTSTLNHHIGTKGLNLSEVAAEGAKRNPPLNISQI